MIQYYVIREYVTCHHNHGSDCASYSNDHSKVLGNSYSHAIELYDEQVEKLADERPLNNSNIEGVMLFEITNGNWTKAKMLKSA